MKVKKESEKNLGLKLNIQKMNIMASSPITSLLTPGELDNKKGCVPKNWCFWTLVLEKTLENPLGSKEIKPDHPKGNQPLIFTGRTDAEAPILWPPNLKN